MAGKERNNVKRFWKECAVILAVLLVLPWLVFGAAGPESGLLVSVMLLLAANPVFFAFLGMHMGSRAGQGLFAAACVVLAAGVVFFAGVRWTLDMAVGFALRYTAAYLAIGYGAMALTVLAAKRREKKRR